ncbi:MAG: deoxyribonuclease IV [Thermodesulfobacteriota bacterium]
MKFGAHVSIAGGIYNAPLRALDLGCECFQMFTRSPRGGKPPELTGEILESFFKNCDNAGIENYYVHTPYFINIASKMPDLRSNSVELIKDELRRSSILKAKYMMTHIGSAKDMARKDAVNNVADSLDKIMESYDGFTKLLLENTAGQGDTIGVNFEEIAEILEKAESNDIGVCLDTAHMFASGYDLRKNDDINNLVKIISNTIKLEKVCLIHGNDSKVDFNSNKDRHEHIGRGKIGKEGFKSLINNIKLSKFDMIVETPVEGVSKDIQLLKNLRDN